MFLENGREKLRAVGSTMRSALHRVANIDFSCKKFFAAGAGRRRILSEPAGRFRFGRANQ
jgi:hypothetical protein